MGRPRKKAEAENVTYRQIEEYVSLAKGRIPGLRYLEISVTEEGKVSFNYEVRQTYTGSGTTK